MVHTFIVVLGLLSIGDGAPPGQGVADIENAVLAARRSIRKGTVTLEADISRDGAPYLLRRTTLWFDYDRDRVRSDVVNHWRDEREPPFRFLQCRNCERPNYLVDYKERNSEESVQALKLVPMARGNRTQLTQIFDPRLLGLAPVDAANLHHHHFESILARPDRENLTLRRDRWKDMDCVIIGFRTLSRTDIQVWVVPGLGNSVTRVVSQSQTNGNKPYVQSTESEVEPVGRSGIWYPKRCIHERALDGKVIEREVLRVLDVSLNEPVDDSVFTLAGMKIPVNTPIVGETSDGQFRAWSWNGSAVVDSVTPGARKPPAGADRRPILLLAAVAFALVALGAFWAFFRRRNYRTSA